MLEDIPGVGPGRNRGAGCGFHVVAVGTSANHLDPLCELAAHLPCQSGVAFLVAQGIGPEAQSDIFDRVSGSTAMPVHRADSLTVIEPNAVYLIPFGYEAEVQKRKLLLTAVSGSQERSLLSNSFSASLGGDIAWCVARVDVSHIPQDGPEPATEFTVLSESKAASAHYRFMIESSTSPICLIDEESRVIYCNAAMCRILGYSTAELTQLHVPDFDTEHSLADYKAVFANAASETLPSFESEWRRKDGTTLPVEVSVSGLTINGTQYLSAHVRDISSRVAADQEMRIRDLALESAMNGILITDATLPDNPITYANPGFSEMTGYSNEEVIGRNCRFLQGRRTDPQAVAEIRDAIREGRRCRKTLLNYRKDGKRFWNDLQITPVFDKQNRLKHFIGVQHDVTFQVESEASVRKYADRITSILNATAEGIYGIDSSGICSFCNATAVRLLGYDSVEDLVGHNIHELVHSRSASGQKIPESECAIYRAVRTNTPIEVSTEVFWRKDGTSFPVQYRCQPKGSTGSSAGAVVSFKDITDQLRIQRELQSANRAARKASKAKSEFLANMSHELRTPMTALLGFSEMLRSHSSDPAYLEKVDTIKRNGEYLLALLNDILDLSKIEAGKMDVKSEPVDVALMIEDLRSLMDVRAAEEGIPLKFEYIGEVPVQVTADRIRVRQILVNLISNALKFTDRGEVRVRIGIVDHPTERAQLGIEVSDEGIGMTAEQMSRLFQPFTQATEDTARIFGGTGLGLSISLQLAKRMRGAIDVESQHGEGSRFTLRLPVSDDQLLQRAMLSLESNKAAVEDRDSDDLPHLNAHILLADDRRDVWRVARFFLEKHGAQVEIAEDGRQAVDAVERADRDGTLFDLILMDMQMPVMTGQEAVAELRGQGYKLPIIALTADVMEGERDACLAIGCDDYSPKPIDGPALIRLIDRHLARSREPQSKH